MATSCCGRSPTPGVRSGAEGRNVHKGSKVYVEGKLKTRKFTDKSGIERYFTEIHVDTLELLGSQSAGNTHASDLNE